MVSQQLEETNVESLSRPQQDPQPTPADAATAFLAVDGMHCSTCERFLESVAMKRDGIYDAQASYAAETIKLTYDSEQLSDAELPGIISGLGYVAREKGEDFTPDADLQSRLLVGAIFSMMAMTWYVLFLYPTYFGFDPIVSLGTFDAAYLYGQLAVVTAIILLYTGGPMLRGAYVSLRTRQPNVDLLVTIAALAAFVYSTARLVTGGADLYYDVTIVVVMAVTVGNYYEIRIKRRTAGLLSELVEMQVTEATTRDGETVPVESVEAGMELLVTPGDRIPVDGTVAEGTAAVDEALLTGESVPTTKRQGDAVSGGTIVTDSPLVVEAGDGAKSTLDRIVARLWEIQATRPSAQRIADRLATVFVPLVLALAVCIVVASILLGGSVESAILVGLTVLIVSCPCALGLATPMAVASGLQSAARRGIVLANPALFERAPAVDTVVFDKTGTLTTGRMTVTSVYATDCDRETLLERAASVEQYAEHPIGAAITDAVATSPSAVVDAVEQYPRGVAGTDDDHRVLAGHPSLFDHRDWEIPSATRDSIDAVEADGGLPTVVGWDGRARGVIGVSDELRPGWQSILDTVGATSRVIVLSGDDPDRVKRIETHPAVDGTYAGMPPDGKAEAVRRLAGEGTVAMVGDGSNDAPALAEADVGIALESGTQLASDAADAIVLEDDLERLPDVFDVAARTNGRIKQNIAWAFLYNGIAIPLAIAGLLNPLFAAIAMATSSLVVVANSARGVSADELEQSTAAAHTRSDVDVANTQTAD